MLQGSFDTFDFAEVLVLLARKNQTGKLRLHSGPATADLYLADGKLIHAESVDHGSPPRVANSRNRLEEACFEVLRWDHGSFEFHPGAAPQAPRGLDASVESVLAGARKRLESWERVESIIPSMDVQPRLVAELRSDEIIVDRQSWRVLAAIDGRRTVQALARILSVSSYELCQLLSTLVNHGLVEVNTPPKVTIAPPAPGRAPSLPSVRLPETRVGSRGRGSAAGNDTGGDGLTGNGRAGSGAGTEGAGREGAGKEGKEAAGQDVPAAAGGGADGAGGTGRDDTRSGSEPGPKVKAASAMRRSARLRLRPTGG